MKTIVIQLPDSSYDSLLQYSMQSGKAAKDIAASIINSAMMHFLAGKIAGMDTVTDMLTPQKKKQ